MTAQDASNQVVRATGHALNNALTAILNYAAPDTVAGLRCRAAAERAAAVAHRMLLLVPGRPSPTTAMDLNQAVIDVVATARMVHSHRGGAVRLHPTSVPVRAAWSAMALPLLDALLDPGDAPDVAVHGDGSVTAGETRWQYERHAEAAVGAGPGDLPGAPVPDLLRGDGGVHLTGDPRAVELAARVLEAAGYAVDASGTEVSIPEPASSIDVLLAVRRALASTPGSNR